MESGENMVYRRNCQLDTDTVQTPKEEYLERWETPDFFEFDRVYKCSRAEFIYLIKGIAYSKCFNMGLTGDN